MRTFTAVKTNKSVQGFICATYSSLTHVERGTKSPSDLDDLQLGHVFPSGGVTAGRRRRDTLRASYWQNTRRNIAWQADTADVNTSCVAYDSVMTTCVRTHTPQYIILQCMLKYSISVFSTGHTHTHVLSIQSMYNIVEALNVIERLLVRPWCSHTDCKLDTEPQKQTQRTIMQFSNDT